MAIVYGNASPTVLAAYKHDLTPSKHGAIPCCETDFDSKWGLAGYYLTRGELGNAVSASRDLIAIAERQEKDDKRVLALRMAGLTELLLGNLNSAIFNLRMCISTYDFSRHGALCHHYGSDQLALAYAHLAWAQALGGEVLKSRQNAKQARRQANILQHAHTSAHVTGVLSLVYEINGQLREARAMDLACATLAQHHKFPYWDAWSDIMRASLAVHRSPEQAVRNLCRAVEKYSETGARQLMPWAFARAAKAYLMLGHVNEAWLQVSAGLNSLTDTGIRVFEPELRFWQAQCLMRQGQAVAAELVLREFSGLTRSMKMNTVLRDEIYPQGLSS